MIVLKYGKSKLIAGAAATFLLIPLYISLLLYPPRSHYGIIAFLGHHPRLAPMLIGVLLVFVWRGITLAAGETAALEATPTELVLTNYWGTRRLPWRMMTQISGKVVRTRYGSSEYLVVRSADGETKLSLGSTDMDPAGLDALVDNVDGLRRGALRAGAGAPAAARRAPVAAEAATLEEAGAFDAEAVMARYLAEKARQGSTAPVAAAGLAARAAPALPAPQVAPPRTGFGRKGL